MSLLLPIAAPAARGAQDAGSRVPAAVEASEAGAPSVDPLRSLSARPPSFGLDVWSEANNLPQGTVRAIVQTRDGFLWLGTRGGVARFDGVSFTTFGVGSRSLLDDEVTGLVEDAQGVLWIGTYAGLTAYRDGRFTSYDGQSGLPDSWIRALDVDSNGDVWIGTPKGVCRHSSAGFRCFTTADGLCSDSVRAICARAGEGVFVAAGTGLSRFADGRFVDASSVLDPRDGRVRALAAGRDGSLLIGFEKPIVKRVRGGVLQTLTSGVGTMVNSLLEDGQGNLWVCDMGSLRRFRDGQPVRIFAGGDETRLGPVWTVCPDREGSLWVGTLSEGLARLRTGAIETLGAADRLPSDVIESVFEDHARTVWVGTTNGLVAIRQGQMLNQRQASGLPITMVSSVAEAGDGAIWIAAGRELLVRSQGTFEPCPGWKQGEVDIRVIYRDSRGRMWIGTDGEGLYRIEKGRVTPFHRSDGLGADSIRDIREDRHGALWIATFGGGVSKLAGGRFTSLTAKDGLASDVVHAILEDDDGALYFATRGGLSRLAGGRLTTYREEDGLFANFILAILDDGRGNFWFACARGIFSVSKADLRALADGRIRRLHSRPYGVRDGLRTTSCVGGHQPTSIKTTNGRLLFCTMKGLAIVDAARLTTNPLPPPVHVVRAVFDGQALDPGQFATLPPGVRNVEISYAGLSYVAPEKVRFRYRLEGFEKDWVDPGLRRFAHYANLRPGDYRFRVTASNNDGVWNESGASFTFRLRPGLTQTYWFYAFLGLAAVALVAGAVRWRVRGLVKRQRELRQGVEEALAKIKVLRGLIPICASCKKIRDDQGFWGQFERYIREHSEAEFSHGLCPECTARLYPGLDLDDDADPPR